MPPQLDPAHQPQKDSSESQAVLGLQERILLLDLFIHSSVHMLGTYYVPGSVLGAGTQVSPLWGHCLVAHASI